MSCKSEAVVQWCSVKKMLLKISQNSQENTCAKAFFLKKLQAPHMEIQNSHSQVFLNSCSERFPKIHRKHQCRSIVLIKLQVTACSIVEEDTPTQIFYSNHILKFYRGSTCKKTTVRA